jgi:hypothetical protein
VLRLALRSSLSSLPPKVAPAVRPLLAEFEKNQPVANADIIVLSEHVDYWNSLGWKDPFSAPLFTDRQKFFASVLHSDDVYTPQAVIDGRVAIVGSRSTGLLNAIKQSAKQAKPSLQVSVTHQGQTLLVIATPLMQGRTWVALTESSVTSQVAHGENAGQTLRHVGVVRYLGQMTGNHASIIVNKSWGSDLRLVVFVQDTHSGQIIQAVQKEV